MSKKLLNEATVRRFAQLANVQPAVVSNFIAETYTEDLEEMKHQGEKDRDDESERLGAKGRKDFKGDKAHRQEDERDDTLGDWGTRTKKIKEEEELEIEDEIEVEEPVEVEDEIEVVDEPETEAGAMLDAVDTAEAILNAVADILGLDIKIEDQEMKDDLEAAEDAELEADAVMADAEAEVAALDDEADDLEADALALEANAASEELVQEVLRRVRERLAASSSK